MKWAAQTAPIFKFLRYFQASIPNSSIPLNYEWKRLPQGKHAWNKIKTVVGLVTAFCWQVSLAVTLKFIPAIQFCLQAKKASRRTQKKENTMKQARKIAIKYFPSQQYVFSRCLGWWWCVCVCVFVCLKPYRSNTDLNWTSIISCVCVCVCKTL